MVTVYHEGEGQWPSEIVVENDESNFRVEVFPDGETSQLVFPALEKLSVEAINKMLPEVMGVIRSHQKTKNVYVEVEKTDDTLLEILTGNGFEVFEHTDDYDYYGLLSQMPTTAVEELGTIEYSPELVGAIKNMMFETDEHEGERFLKETGIMLGSGYFRYFDITCEEFYEGGKNMYCLELLKQCTPTLKGDKEIFPCEFVRVFIDPQNGFIMSYEKFMQYRYANGSVVQLPGVANGPYMIDDSSQVEIADKDEMLAMGREIGMYPSEETLKEIIEIVNMTTQSIKDEC